MTHGVSAALDAMAQIGFPTQLFFRGFMEDVLAQMFSEELQDREG